MLWPCCFCCLVKHCRRKVEIVFLPMTVGLLTLAFALFAARIARAFLLLVSTLKFYTLTDSVNVFPCDAAVFYS